MKKIVICGSTGSIGLQTLEVIAADPDLKPVGLSAGSNWEACLSQAKQHGVGTVCLRDSDAADSVASNWSGEVLVGDDGLERLIRESGADLVVNAIVGADGLTASVVALGEGMDLALANKESLVIAGPLITALAEAGNCQILPIDSEHSATAQLLAAAGPGTVDRITLTASGGPFRQRRDLGGVTPEEALEHPTWSMGGKISIDSATLMNKGLELIEAHYFFGVGFESLDVVVHPQSIVHALVGMNDGATLAHLGHPDMRVPISWALHFPDRADVDVPMLDLADVGRLDFEAPDLETFRCLPVAIQAGRDGGLAPCVLNAANEVAVERFLQGSLPFTEIPTVIESTLTDLDPPRVLSHFSEVTEWDSRARSTSEAFITGVQT